MSIFHLAFNIGDLDTARAFYGDLLGCTEGRSTDTWVDFDFFGHQISLHLGEPFAHRPTGKVGDHMVPMPHFGVLLQMDAWRVLADRLKAADVDFVIDPVLRFEGEPGEQATMFLLDPFGNPLEFKGMRDLSGAFAT
ncbi:VOC family protein [Jannaschia donghaensis]|uniref:Putative dioxygenase of extradiol dioxygenase family protein n=1 Tax=Jannaschia donghaensis TaxID=420998 RepID=A0A0M6YEB9_9RHOB|nr:VOC family protein [Jannaschia donghaensis]CTQ48691.1 putative dioxygenase of extradiol dioxygenase family protein [Jannaschia donghaensis]